MNRTWSIAWLPLALLTALGVGAGLLLARLPLLEAGLLVGVALTLLASLFEPLAGLVVALFAGVCWAWLRAELPQVPALLGQYLFVLVAAIWAARKLARRDLRIPLPPLLLPLLGFMGVALLSLWQPVDPWVGFMEWAKWGQLLLICLVAYDRLSARSAPWLVAGLVGVGAFQACVGLWQYGLRGDGPDHFMIREGFYRAYGTFEQPNPYGGFIGILTALLLGMALATGVEAWQRRRWPARWVWLAAPALFLLGGALGATWSRGAWLGFGAVLLALGALLPRRGLWGVLLVTLLVVGGLGLYSTGLLPTSLASRLTGFLDYVSFSDVRGIGINDANYAVVERMAHWQAALEMWRNHFWLGIGLGCYEPAYPAYRLINWPFALGHAHNYYLTLLAETGLLGLLAYLTFIGTVFWGLWRATRSLSGWQRGLALGLVGAWSQFAAHDLVDNLLVNNVHLLMGMLLALTAWVLVNAFTAERAAK